MNGHAYGFLTAGTVDPGALVRVLGEAFEVSGNEVDVAPYGQVEGRNWDAPVTGDHEHFDGGDIACAITVYAGPAVPDPPTDEALGRALARGLGTTVLLDRTSYPSVHLVLTPSGSATFARVEDPEPEDPGAGFRVTATHTGVAAFPRAAVEGLPEVVRDLPLAPRGTDPRLWEWTDLICRMEAGWPPLRWYGIDQYREDLRARDTLAAAAHDAPGLLLPELAALDARFRAVTVEDGGEELGADPSDTAWYWHRRPAVLPWRVLLPADPEGAHWLWEWVGAGFPAYGDLTALDLSGARLTGADFTGTLFTGARLAGTRLLGADFYRCDLQGADLTGAEATGACFVKANLDGAVLRGAVLDGADLAGADLYGTDARGARLRGARILAATLWDTDLRGADLSGAELRENTFKVLLDDGTRVAGLTGTAFGPAQLSSPDGTRAPLAGSALEDWIRARGGDVRVIEPLGPRPLREAG
ncbi:pentapeptide repeat-containing protein [Streptomyces sp. NBC_00249]|uniref:pentapeptide repeat-containing protein n=1 Tax=Streptomyces sp. NBC_00249 TaxID=2975690 RepID=UPI002250A66B|nr:pentapeptide repeat-containing protein [Streptomyces sp. NBC_00249]MCX5198603.1 pentapeptide repeat-containing protein [Streptomyces sp. NBC_00249]